MNKVKLLLSISIFFVIFLSILSFNTFAGDLTTSENWKHQKIKKNPDNLIKSMTFIASRPFNSADGSFLLDGVFGGDGMNFFKNVLGLTDQEIKDRRNSAIEFFATSFGIMVNDPRVYFTGFQIDPATDYRTIMMTGEEQRIGEGYPVLEGGFLLAVTHPDGIDLGGEFEGLHVPAGALFVAGGAYVIQPGKGKPDIVLNLQSRWPNLPYESGRVLNMEVSHPEWGKGLAWGNAQIHKLANGQDSSQVRVVLTFPGLGIEENLME